MEQFNFTRFILMLVFAACASAVQAQVFVKHDAAGSNNGTSWANAFTSVDQALSSTTTGAIWVAAGTYKPGGATPTASSVFTISDNIALYGGFNGTETALDQRDPVANATILSGDLNSDDIQNNFTANKSDNTIHVVYVDSLLTDVVIDGFSIIGGHTLDDANVALFQRAGGGIFARSPVTINRCQFYNHFGRSGGAVYLPAQASGSSVSNSTFSWNSTSNQSAGILASGVNGLTLTDCTFSNNQTVRGALYALQSNNVNLTDCTFDLNTNTVGPGGALWSFTSTNVTMTDCFFTNNKAVNSGAVYMVGTDLANSDDPDNFVLTSCLFSNNEATTETGGAFRCVNGSYTLDDCVFSGNKANGSGGHIQNSTDGDEVVYKNCLFEDAESGGWGGAHTCYGNGNVTVTNCEYKNNKTANLGGAANCGLGVGHVTFDGCTFTGNGSNTASGGAVYVQNDNKDLTILNSFFENNTSVGSGGAIGVGGSQTTVVENCDFLFNMSGDFGGAINVFEGAVDISSFTVLNSSFILNQAANQGGAISTGDADASFVSCLFAENLALGNSVGGAISLNASDSNTVNVSILHCTIAKNEADIGAGLSQWTGTVDAVLNTTVQNSIFFNENGDNYAIEAGTPNLISNGGNMSSDLTLEDVFTDPNDLNDTEPIFVDPDDFDYTLTLGSPGIDAGVAAGSPPTDMLGNPRINLPDMGAVENQDVTNTKETLLENDGMLSVLPNPARGTTSLATLKNDWSGALQVRITNLQGQAVRGFEVQKTGGDFRFDLPLAGLEKGVYQVTVSDGEKMVAERLIRL